MFSATTAAILAIVGCAVGVAGLGFAAWAWARVGRLREAQRTLVGGSRTDLVDFAVSLQGRIDDLHRAVDEVAAGLARIDRRVDGSVTNSSIVRYDAYEDTGGHQSASLALLDSARTGVVVTAIQGRDYARIYMKELERGRAAVPLSPEEQEAVDRADEPGATTVETAGAAGSLDCGRSSGSWFWMRLRPLNVCSVRRAHVLVFKGKAEVVETPRRPLRSASDTFGWPYVIRLSPTSAFRGWSSGGSRGGHSSPVTAGAVSIAARRAAGSRSTTSCRGLAAAARWENVVTSCAPCNLRKGDRSRTRWRCHCRGSR